MILNPLSFQYFMNYLKVICLWKYKTYRNDLSAVTRPNKSATHDSCVENKRNQQCIDGNKTQYKRIYAKSCLQLEYISAPFRESTNTHFHKGEWRVLGMYKLVTY